MNRLRRVADLAPAAWLPPRLRRWGVQDPPRVSSLAPGGYEAYARVLVYPERRAGEPGALAAGVAGCTGLAAVLTSAAPDLGEVWFGLWEGYGDIEREGPRFETAHRRYLLLRGDLMAAATGQGLDSPTPHVPDLWWPDDHSWFVGMDTDLAFAYVAGEPGLVDLVVERLPAERANEDDRVDAAGEPPFRD